MSNAVVEDGVKVHEQLVKCANKQKNMEMRVATRESFATALYCRQGDVYIVYVGPGSMVKTVKDVEQYFHSLPGWWRNVRVPTEGKLTSNMQLADGNTTGSRHILRQADHGTGALKVYRAENPGQNIGPFFESSVPVVIEHPEHAHFTLPACEPGGRYYVFGQIDAESQQRVAD